MLEGSMLHLCYLLLSDGETLDRVIQRLGQIKS